MAPQGGLRDTELLKLTGAKGIDGTCGGEKKGKRGGRGKDNLLLANLSSSELL